MLITIDKQHLLNALNERGLLAEISMMRKLIKACEHDIKSIESYLQKNTEDFKDTQQALSDIIPITTDCVQEEQEGAEA